MTTNIIHVPDLNLPRSNKLTLCIVHDIDSCYCSIINALDFTLKLQCMPYISHGTKIALQIGMNNVSHFYDRSRIEFKWCVSNNRSRQRPIYHTMRSARAKYANRQCKLDERLILSIKLANHHAKTCCKCILKRC